MKVYILCGGAGTRLFPISNDVIPKQFISVTKDNKTLLTKTIDRLKELNYDINLISNIKYKNNFIDYNYNSIIYEPISRNTAPAILIATLLSDDENILILPSDQIIQDDINNDSINKFKECINAGLNNLTDENIILFGIKPTYAETGYGYINISDINNKINDVLIFKEKPDKKTAEFYYQSEKYLWNSGIFMFKKKYMLEQFENYYPDMVNLAIDIIKNINSRDIIYLPDIYNNMSNISIDYAIIEKVKNRVITYDGLWSDVGSYKSIYNLYDEENVNLKNCKLLINNSKGNLIISDEPIFLNNISNKCIVKSDIGIMITDLDSSQSVKDLYNNYINDK